MELNSKQKKILDVAEKLFADQSFDGTSVRTIAQEAGVNIAMISYYFGSKEKLLETLIIYRLSHYREQLEKIIYGDASYLEKVENIIELMVRRIHKNRRVHKIVNFEFSNGGRNIDLQKFIQGKKENLKLLENFISEGQKAGAFAPNINTSLLIPTIYGTYFHFYHNKGFYSELLGLTTQKSIDDYVNTTLTKHIQQTLKGLLTYEN